MPSLLRCLAFFALPATAACTSDPTEVVVQLAPDVVSSLDGTLAVRAIVLGGQTPIAGAPLQLAIDYTDRSGTAHTIAPVSGSTDDVGVFEATFDGLTWDGHGTVTATGGGIEGVATFAVLDRTPPKVEITPPAANTIHRGSDLTVSVHATDEIGISQVFFGSTVRARDRSLVTSGANDLTLDFDFTVPDQPAGTTFQLFALAEDRSGNQGAATPITLTVIP
jgi:hypothetical protein